MRLTKLQCMEVIADGRRLGYITDLEIENGRVCAIVVPGPCKWLLSHREEYVIPWNKICRLGPDVIQADICPEECCCPKALPKLL